MPRNSKTKNTDALHAIHRGETPPYHQLMYCIKTGMGDARAAAQPWLGEDVELRHYRGGAGGDGVTCAQAREGIERTLWEVREPRNHPIIRAGEHPELSWLYTTECAARAAAEAVAERLADVMTARAERWNEREQPDAAKRAWADDSKTACFTEMRVTGWAVEWGADRDRHRPRWWPEDNVMTLTVDTEVRHRWREVRHRREVAEDGTITVVDALGEPSEWTEWHAPLPLESGGLHFSPVSLEVRPTKLRFAPGQDRCGVGDDDAGLA